MVDLQACCFDRLGLPRLLLSCFARQDDIKILSTLDRLGTSTRESTANFECITPMHRKAARLCSRLTQRYSGTMTRRISHRLPGPPPWSASGLCPRALGCSFCADSSLSIPLSFTLPPSLAFARALARCGKVTRGELAGTESTRARRDGQSPWRALGYAR
jgi:hypothetical protein